MVIVIIIIVVLVAAIAVLNAMVMKTNYWRNKTEDMRMIPRPDRDANRQICCLGSSFARYGIEFDESIGINLATNNQSLEYDLKMFKRYIPMMKEHSKVLITIGEGSLFFLKEHQQTGYKYYRYLETSEIDTESRKNIYCNAIFPIAQDISLIKYIFKDVARYDKFAFETNPCNRDRMVEDALRRMSLWENSFSLYDSEKVNCAVTYNLDVIKRIVETARANKIKPIILILPKSESYKKTVSDSFWPIDVSKEILALSEVCSVDVIDKSGDIDLSLDMNYINSLCLNKRARMEFSKYLLRELVEECIK